MKRPSCAELRARLARNRDADFRRGFANQFAHAPLVASIDVGVDEADRDCFSALCERLRDHRTRGFFIQRPDYLGLRRHPLGEREAHPAAG